MWLSPLPDPHYFHDPGEAPSFAENILFTEKLQHRYSYPEHHSPLGIVTLLDGNGSFAVNRRSERLDNKTFLVVNTHSRLAIDHAGEASKPALLFFQAKLPAMMAASLILPDKQLLDDPLSETEVDFSILERAHPMTESLRSRLALLESLGGGCSSFAALKADLVVRSVLEELMLNNRLALTESYDLQVKKKSTRIELYKRICLAREWIHDNYHLPLSLDDLAAIACMNSQHFLRTFKKLLRCTPHQYIMRVRLEQARRMLLETDDTVHTICRNTGMESLSSFSWLFRQRFGEPPTALRKK